MRASALGLPALLLIASCSSFPLQRERVARVRSVAIVGFTVEVDTSYEEEGEAYDPERKAWQPKEKLRISHRNLSENRELEKIHQILAAGLESGLHWKVLPSDRLAASEEYLLLLQSRVGKTWQPEELRGPSSYGFPDRLGFDEIKKLTPENRRKILEQTGTDALVSARVTLRIDKTDAFSISGLLGVGAYYPTAVLELMAFDAQEGGPIWHDKDVESDPDVEGTFQIGGKASDEHVMGKALTAVKSSVEALLQRYADAK